jgi:hypothetical protein
MASLDSQETHADPAAAAAAAEEAAASSPVVAYILSRESRNLPFSTVEHLPGKKLLENASLSELQFMIDALVTEEAIPPCEPFSSLEEFRAYAIGLWKQGRNACKARKTKRVAQEKKDEQEQLAEERRQAELSADPAENAEEADDAEELAAAGVRYQAAKRAQQDADAKAEKAATNAAKKDSIASEIRAQKKRKHQRNEKNRKAKAKGVSLPGEEGGTPGSGSDDEAKEAYALKEKEVRAEVSWTVKEARRVQELEDKQQRDVLREEARVLKRAKSTLPRVPRRESVREQIPGKAGHRSLQERVLQKRVEQFGVNLTATLLDKAAAAAAEDAARSRGKKKNNKKKKKPRKGMDEASALASDSPSPSEGTTGSEPASDAETVISEQDSIRSDESHQIPVSLRHNYLYIIITHICFTTFDHAGWQVPPTVKRVQPVNALAPAPS